MKLTSDKLNQIIKEQIREAMEDYPHNRDKVFAKIKDQLLNEDETIREAGKRTLEVLSDIEKISDLYYNGEETDQKIYDLRDMLDELFGTQSNLGKEIRTKLKLR